MDVYVRGLVGSSAHEIQSEDDMVGAMDTDVKKGPWTDEEDVLLMNYVRVHGEGRWNLVAHFSGLKRTGKSCRLRWLNYLRPDVRRGNITLEEQLLILELHSRWGNRWSKIAKYLPGRTDNEIKNYWRTRVQKQAKQLKCDVNSKEFRDAMRNVWMPQMAERIQRASSGISYTDNFNTDIPTTGHSSQSSDRVPIPEISGVTSESNSDAQFSPVSDMSECYHPLGYVDNNPSCYNYPNSQSEPWPEYSENRSGWTSTPSGPDTAANMFEEMSNVWLGGGETSMESFWNDENVWFLQQQLSDEDLI